MYVVVEAAAAWQQYIVGLVVVVDSRGSSQQPLVEVVSRQGVAVEVESRQEVAVVAVVADVAVVSGVSGSSYS